MALLQCPECGNSISDRATVCPKCGTPLQPIIPQQGPAQGFTQQVFNAVPQRPTLTSEQEQFLDSFHWGSFTFGWIWALCNELIIHGLIALVISVFTSGIGAFVASLVFGFKGNRWAWEKSKTRTFEEYAQKQEPWDKWGKIVFLGSLVLCIVAIIIAIVVATAN